MLNPAVALLSFVALFPSQDIGDVSNFFGQNMVKIEIHKTGGYLPPADSLGRTCMPEQILTIDVSGINRVMNCTQSSTLLPGIVLHKNRSFLDFSVAGALINSILDLVSSQERPPSLATTLMGDDWLITLIVRIGDQSYVLSTLRHDENLGPKFKAVIEKVETFSEDVVPFSKATLQKVTL